jgi:hypothetical protein
MHETSRRQFANQLLSVTGVALVGTRTLGAADFADGRPSSEGELFTRMKWLNEPASATISGSSITVRARPQTDFWRKTLYGHITDKRAFLLSAS